MKAVALWVACVGLLASAPARAVTPEVHPLQEESARPWMQPEALLLAAGAAGAGALLTGALGLGAVTTVGWGVGSGRLHAPSLPLNAVPSRFVLPAVLFSAALGAGTLTLLGALALLTWNTAVVSMVVGRVVGDLLRPSKPAPIQAAPRHPRRHPAAPHAQPPCGCDAFQQWLRANAE